MRLPIHLRPWGAMLVAGALALPAVAQDAKTLHLRSLAATCANCHGTQGRAVDGASVPGLAGMPASYIADQMRAFKAGTRPATVMHQLAKGYSDAQIDAVAGYFAAQKK
ncbi:MAG TPA: c-type cytochrome [Burkholderiaceae bacterium]|nr:c-type cytochrome [Burkholderiaceae bacterium]